MRKILELRLWFDVPTEKLGDAALTAVQRWKYASGGSETETEVSISFEPKR